MIMRRLNFIERTVPAYLDALARFVGEGASNVRLRGWDALTPEILEKARKVWPGIVFSTPEAPDEAAAAPSSDFGEAPVLLFGETGEILSPLMADYIDAEQASLTAPITNHFHRNKVLFLVSIPKSGTHLLFELARALGFADGGEPPPVPGPRPWAGKWYYLEYSNSHTAAADFFVDTVRRSPFGNRDHPFTRNPTLFIYRNPMDIVASEANYYHGDGDTAFFQYLAHLDYDQRLLRLINDPWLLGSIRDRIAKFIAWTDFANVIPVSYEALAGAAAGGDRKVQQDLVWSLQLKLHAPGRPEEIAARVYNENSPTFRVGRIGAGRKRFTPDARAAFDALPQDFMRALGYEDPEAVFPTRMEEFRRRMPRYSRSRFDETPILEKSNVLGHNIIRFRRQYVAVPLDLGDLDVTKMPTELFETLPRSHDLIELMRRLPLPGEDGGRA
jgi:hypothetical protein